MRKLKYIMLCLICLALLLSVVGCDQYSPGYFNVENTPLPVTGTVAATVPTPLPININGVTVNDGSVPSVPYYYQIVDGKVPGHTPWTKIGFTPALGAVSATTESDIWAAGGVINFPTVAQQMQVLSSNNTDDIGTVIFSGNSTGGSTTSLIDTGKNFTAGTSVAIGDVVLLDTTKEYGFVTGVAATTLTVADGFLNGGSGASQAYRVIDTSATSGAQVVMLEYLDASYNTQWSMIALNGTTAVNTVSTTIYRVNSFRVIAAGANKKPTGNITLRNTAGTTVFSYILAGFTRARNSAYTVPAGYTLYVTSVTFSYGYSAQQTNYARMYTRATQNNNFRTDGIFYPFTEVVVANTAIEIELDLPTKILQKVDLKVSGTASASGVGQSTLRGWLETN